MRLNPRFWKESATIIPLAKNIKQDVTSKYSNYKILLQKRSDKSDFLPSTIVFPGGTVENCDAHNYWLDYFKSFGIKDDKFKQFQSKNMLIPPILQDENPLNRHVSLCITAIRETFEELGVLICKQRNERRTDKYASFISDFDVKHWQNKVHKDPLEFMSLCRQLDCYPDIWSLYLWCNWLTPIGYEKHRFDTLFFLTAFQTTPPVFADNTEVSQVLWKSPEEIMKSFEHKEIMLPPPQWYEISKLMHQKDLDTLVNFSAARSPLGCEQIYPILVYPSKGTGWLALFPGDELYPNEPDYEKQTFVRLEDKTINELQNSAYRTHRMELYDIYTLNVKLKNYDPIQSQLSPLHGEIPSIQI